MTFVVGKVCNWLGLGVQRGEQYMHRSGLKRVLGWLLQSYTVMVGNLSMEEIDFLWGFGADNL